MNNKPWNEDNVLARVRESYRNSLLPQIKSSLDEWVESHEGGRYVVEEFSSTSNKYLITVKMNRIPILEIVAYNGGSTLKIRRIGYHGLSEFEPKTSDIVKLLDTYLPIVEELNEKEDELMEEAEERLSDILNKLPDALDIAVSGIEFVILKSK